MIDFKRTCLGLTVFGLLLTSRSSLDSVFSVSDHSQLAASEPIRELKAINRSSFRGSARLTQDKKESGKDAVNEVKIRAVKLNLPESWKEENPSNNMRLAQYKVAPAEGDEPVTELVISSFPGDGGGVDQNFKRWIDQFESNGRKIKMSSGKCEQGEYYVSDISGTYLKSSGGPFAGGKKTPMPGYRSLSLILVIAEKGVYFVRMTGPEKTVESAAVAFRKSFDGDAAKEAEYELNK